MTTFMESLSSKDSGAALSELLKIQSESYGYLDDILISEFIIRSGVSDVIDVGTGEASFLLKLAQSNKHVNFVGIEENQGLYDRAHQSIELQDANNVNVINASIGADRVDRACDLVLTRLVIQHDKNPIELIRNLLALVKKGKFVYMVEPVYDYFDCDPLPNIWRGYRERLLCSYRRLGSDPNIPKRLPGLLLELGCKNVRTSVHLYSCSTIGKYRFCSVVRATAATLHSMHPDLWEISFIGELDAWLDLIGMPGYSDPFISIAHTVANK